MGGAPNAASRDLVPGSDFLDALNRRPRRTSVRYHILAGSGGFLPQEARKQIEVSYCGARIA